MFNKIFIITALFIMIYLSTANAIDYNNDPDIFVVKLYKTYISQINNKYWFDDKLILSKYFDKNLVELFMKDKACKVKNESICALDFDPILDAQDFDEKYTVNINTEVISNNNNKATIKVIFTNISTRTLIYNLKFNGKKWFVTNITYSNGLTLIDILQ